MLLIISVTLFCRYYHNITSNTLVVLEAMAAHGVKTLIYSSTCATYGEPEKMPITETTVQVRVLKLGFHFCFSSYCSFYWEKMVVLLLVIFFVLFTFKITEKNILGFIFCFPSEAIKFMWPATAIFDVYRVL